MMFTLSIVYAQDEYKLPNVIPPSPTAFEFAQYGNTPLNGSTGGFSYQVPLFQLTEGDITVNASLNYFSSGVKIDKLSTEVGVDWSLNAGGVITRVVRDNPDELVQYRWYPESISVGDDYNNIKAAAGDNSNNFDTEPDWFSFNVNGISGEFYFDEDLNIQINSEEHLVLTKNSDLTRFELLDNNGFKYIFGGAGDEIETNFSSNDCDRSSRLSYKTSWFLVEIISPKGNSITFDYIDSTYKYVSAVSNTINLDEDCYCSPSTETYTYNHSKCVSYSLINTKLISRINSSLGYIEFEYQDNRPDVIGQSGHILKRITRYSSNGEKDSYDLDYAFTVSDNHRDNVIASFSSLKNRFFLNEIIHTDSQGLNESNYKFEYLGKEQLPCRLSYSKDIFGYHNNSDNYKPFANPKDSEAYGVANRYASHLIGADRDVNPGVTYYGMLSKIVYPTKGATNIKYEANSDIGLTESEVTESNAINLSKGCNDPTPKIGSFTFTSNGSPINYSVNATIDTYICNSEPDAIHDKYIVFIKDLTTGEVVRSFSRPEGNYISTDSYLSCAGTGSTSLIYNPVCTVSGHQYEVSFTISSKFSQISGAMRFDYNKSQELVEEINYGGGARVSQIFDEVDGEIQNQRNFYYNKLEEYQSNNTSLNKIFDPKYSQFFSNYRNCIPVCCSDLVSVEHGNCAAEVINLNSSNKKRYSISSGSLNSLYNNRKQNVYYDAISILYSNGGSANGAEERFFHRVGDNLPSIIKGPAILGVPSSNNTDRYYGQLDSLITYKSTNSGFVKLKKEEREYSIFGSDYQKAYSFRKNYDFAYIGVTEQNVDNISISLYQNYLQKKRLKSIKITEFMDDKKIVNDQSFQFGGAPYYSKTHALKESSRTGEIKLEKFYYPQYVPNPNTVEQRMIDDNLISNILSIEKYKVIEGNEILLGGTLNKYKITEQDRVLVDKIASFKRDLNPQDRLTFHRYDSSGNPLVVSQVSGPHAIYIWGYNDQYLIAKIENSKESEVSSILGNLSDVNESDLDAINNLRTGLPNAMVTTYEYDPLIGVTKIIDPKGLVITYHYDDFNRLELIKDHQNNILKEYKYNYRASL